MSEKNKKLFIVRFLLPVILLIAALLLFTASFHSELLKISFLQKTAVETSLCRQYPIMGTMAEIKLSGNAESIEIAADKIQEELSAVEETCSIFNEKSEMSRLNKNAGEKPFVCSDLLWEVLLESKYFYELTEGAFDISMTPLMQLWGFYRKRKTLPSEEEIIEAKKHIGLDKAIFNMEEHSIKFVDPELRFDLGGIAKGYAVDRAAEAAKKCGIASGTINLGGNIYCFQPSSSQSGAGKYAIGIRNPSHKDKLCGKVEVLETAVATSGNYERYVIINGVYFTHIMDPQKGEPVKDMLSVTVITPKAIWSDALSTAIFIKGEEFARKICMQYPSTYVLIIRKVTGKTKMIKIGNIWADCRL